MFLRILILTLLFSQSLLAQNPLDEFYAIKKDALVSSAIVTQDVVFATEKYWVLKSALTNFESYDYYAIQVPQNTRQYLRENSQVVLETKDSWLITKINHPKQLQEIAQVVHRAGHFCGGIRKITGRNISLEKQRAEQLVSAKRQDIADAVQLVDVDNILNTMTEMQNWGTRHHKSQSGKTTAPRLKKMYEAFVPSHRNDVTIDLIDHSGSDQQSIRVQIQGASQPEEILILGSHIDSINNNNNQDAPGADDNASGTATNLEVFRVLMASGFVPQKTIEIHGYGAEEIGLVGSGEMAEDYKRQNKKVMAMVQFDMNGFAKNSAKISFVTNSTDSSLTRQLQTLVDQYLDIPHSSGFLLFGSSDHASWNQQGYPVAFPTEDPFGFNRKIHSKDDKMSGINSPEQIHEFGKLGVAYFMDFSS